MLGVLKNRGGGNNLKNPLFFMALIIMEKVKIQKEKIDKKKLQFKIVKNERMSEE